MNKKKVIIPLVLVLAAGGSFGGYKVYKDGHDRVDVMPVSSLESGYYDDSALNGMIYDSKNQSITLDGTAAVSAVYVSEGQQVKAGDRLLAYDLSDLQLSVQMKKLAVEQAQNQLQGAQIKLKQLKNTKPKQTPVPAIEPTEFPSVHPDENPKSDQKENGLYAYVDSLSDAYTSQDNTGDTNENPLRFACMKDGEISMKVLSEAKALLNENKPALYLSFEGYALNDGEVFDPEQCRDKKVSEWQVKVTSDTSVDENQTFSLMPVNGVDEEEPAQTEAPEQIDENDTEEQGYTAEQLASAIRDTQNSIRSLDLDVRRKQLELSDAEKSLKDGIVYARKDGIVTKVSDPASPPQDGSPFLVVSSEDGTVVRGEISELMRDRIKSGDTLTATDWNTGNTYNAVVQSVDTIPENSGSYYGGNPNVSYYYFYAVINDTNDLTSYSGLNMTLPQDDSGSQGIWLEGAYVRKKDGQYYVMKDENGRLKKQAVTVGASQYGSVNIRDGITEEDSIAFPYGKNVREGVRTQMSEGGEVYG